jgi:CRISPR-associated endonuclease/helicase Cas3
LRKFQQEVFKLILQGKNIILQAPTGSGKTRAALAPFIYNLATQGHALPHTCRYAVPMRVLANQFFHEYHSLAEKIDREAPTRLEAIYKSIKHPAVSIQTGEQPDDPQFESALTFCTIDQLLASFLAVPYGLGNNRANLNVGGIIGSYLVLDEFHLYPLHDDNNSIFGARTTTLQMLRLLQSITPFILMTATFSTTLLNQLADLLNAVVVTVNDPQELEAIAQSRSRTFHRSPAPMDAKSILSEHQQREQNKCALIICNTVLRAQQLYLQLQQAEAQGTRVVLLHSRFTTEDRQKLSQEIEQELGPDNWRDGTYLGRDIIVVATQVVEVGLDISVQTLHTENAPANSLIQRAGRCARFAQQQGNVFIYPLPTDEEGREASARPYDKDLCTATWNALEKFDGQKVGFLQEQELIDAVHTSEDEELLKHYKMYESTIIQKICESYNANDRSVTPTLIRNVAQVQVIIHDDPNSAITETPWKWQSFGMHPLSLANPKRWQALQAAEHNLKWVCKEAKPIKEDEKNPDGADGIDNRQQTRYTWDTITNPASISKALVIALPSQLARYDDQLGFVLLDGQLDIEPNGYQSSPLEGKESGNNKNGSKQTSYQGHIQGLVRAYHHNLKNEATYVASRLENLMGLSKGMIDHAIRLAIACHDLGKLNQTWQQWAFNWQKLLWSTWGADYQLPDPTYCFAKTDHNYSSEQRQLQNQVQPKRPRHACESVVIARKMIGTSLGITKTTGHEYFPVLRAICAAIARHHTSQASQHGIAHLNNHALQAAEAALQLTFSGTPWRYDSSQLDLHINNEGDLAPENASTPKLTRPTFEDYQNQLETWLYFVIVRALRLADQRAG